MRKIESEMVVYIDKKLRGNGLAKVALEKKDARLLFRLAAEACVGIKEATGRNDGKMVELIQETYGGASGEPWCMALVQTCLAYAEVKTGLKSPVIASELCYSVWYKTDPDQRVKYLPLPGAIAIWNDIGTTRGHTEIVLGTDGNTLQCIGGNTSGTTKPGEVINREGNAVVYTIRSFKPVGKRKLLGFLKPF